MIEKKNIFVWNKDSDPIPLRLPILAINFLTVHAWRLFKTLRTFAVLDWQFNECLNLNIEAFEEQCICFGISEFLAHFCSLWEFFNFFHTSFSILSLRFYRSLTKYNAFKIHISNLWISHNHIYFIALWLTITTLDIYRDNNLWLIKWDQPNKETVSRFDVQLRGLTFAVKQNSTA